MVSAAPVMVPVTATVPSAVMTVPAATLEPEALCSTVAAIEYMGTAVATPVCEALTVYVPAPPDTPDVCAEMMVPAATPEPETAMPIPSAPVVTAETVSTAIGVTYRPV